MCSRLAAAVTLDQVAAQRLTTEIQELLASAQERINQLVELVAEARSGNAHLAMGYRSWTEYAEHEFGRSPLRLPKVDRQELVVRLADMGMSTRSIGPVVGASQATVDRDRRESTDSPATSRTVQGRDGKQYTVSPRPSTCSTSDLRAAQLHDDAAEGSLPVVSQRTEQQPDQKGRGSRTNVVAVMSRVVTRAADAADAAELIRREHFKQRKEEATRWARDLDNAIQSLQRLADLLKEQTE